MWSTVRKLTRSHNKVTEKWEKIKRTKQKKKYKQKLDYKCIETCKLPIDAYDTWLHRIVVTSHRYIQKTLHRNFKMAWKYS